MHETKAIENKIAIARLYKSDATGLDISFNNIAEALSRGAGIENFYRNFFSYHFYFPG